MTQPFDVIVVGAGLAGAAAADVLARRGHTVCVLEARGRVGGRALTRPFGGSGPALEFGGGWLLPEHRRSHAVGLLPAPRQPVTERRWLRPDGLSLVAPAADLERYAACLEQVAADALRYKAGRGGDLAGLDFAAYLDRLGADADTRAQLAGWWCLSGSGDPGQVAASEFLASCAYGGGRPESLLEVMEPIAAPGAQAAVEDLLRRAGAALRLDAAVVAVEQDGGEARVRLQDGRCFAAARVLLATGVQGLRAIAFDPPLAGVPAEAAAAGHLGRAVKLWMLAEGVPPGSLAVGAGPGLRWLFAARAGAGSAAYLVGFGLAETGRTPDRGMAEACLAAFHPHAKLLDWDWHDWVADPWSRGTWASAPAGAARLFDARHWTPQGRLHFASSDFAPDWPGWFEGAVASGQAAAELADGR